MIVFLFLLNLIQLPDAFISVTYDGIDPVTHKKIWTVEETINKNVMDRADLIEALELFYEDYELPKEIKQGE